MLHLAVVASLMLAVGWPSWFYVARAGAAYLFIVFAASECGFCIRCYDSASDVTLVVRAASSFCGLGFFIWFYDSVCDVLCCI